MLVPHMRQVKASAGSGKTHYITQRFLSLLAQSPLKAHAPQCLFSAPDRANAPSLDQGSAQTTSSNPPSWGDIMAITFTNLAAKEMKERVLKSLKELALEKASTTPPAMDSQKATAWIDIILRQYSTLNIRTIDSLLHLIVRTSALDLGLAPDFESSFDTKELMDPIFEAVLEQAEFGDAHMLSLLENMCHSLLFHANVQGFVVGARMVEALYPLVNMQFTEHLPPLSPKHELEVAYTGMRTTFQSHGKNMLQIIEDEGLAVAAHAKTFFFKCAQMDLSALGSTYVHKTELDQCLNKASKGKASALAEKTFLDLLDSAKIMQEQGEVLQRAIRLHPFLEFSKEIVQKITSLRDQEQKVAHAKIPGYAKDILEFQYGVSSALCRLGNALHHVLLDEFQDTSREQWDALRPLMIEALSHGGSFTWVGDVKQAIYGWRGGDAALFDEVLHSPELTCMCTPDTDSLPTNWRSREAIVNFNNSLFTALSDATTAAPLLQSLLSADCPQEIFDASLNTLTNTFTKARQEVKNNAQGGYVCITPVHGENTAELEEAVCDNLREILVDDIGHRHPWGDVAILVRKNQHASLVAQWLLEWQIPAITENSLLLHTHPLIEESVALLYFLQSPQDDMHFWIVLTGSILRCALAGEENPLPHTVSAPSLQELQHFIVYQRQQKPVRPLYIAFKEQWPEFWEYYFAPFYGSAQVLSPYDCMQEWYTLWCLPQRFPKETTFLRRFLEILHGAEQKSFGTLGTFLDYWEKEGDKEKAPTPANLNAVHIMTVHKSKGLQFPVVIIPWLNFENKDSEAFLVHEVQGLHMLAPRGKYSGKAYYTAQARGALEALNVFYVASTRAQEELYLFHTYTDATKKRKNLANALEILFAAVEMSLPYEVGIPIVKDMEEHQEYDAVSHSCASLAMQKDADSEIIKAQPETETLAAPHPSAPLMQWLPRLKIFRDPLQELLLEASPSAKNRGLLMHHCLEIFQNMGVLQKGASAKDIQQGIAYAVQWGLQTFALPLTLSPQLTAELEQALTWYAKLPHAMSWAQQGLPEQALVDQEGKLHRVDLLIPPQEQHGWRVIEFKTGQENVEHLAQLRRYLSLLDAIPQNITAPYASEGVLLYLDLQQCRMVYAQGQSDSLAAPLWQGEC